MSVSVLSTLLCLPHFFEYKSVRDETSKIVLFEFGLYQDFHYRLIYFSIIDPFLR